LLEPDRERASGFIGDHASTRLAALPRRVAKVHTLDVGAISVDGGAVTRRS
jgi:hypothetical protein